MIDTVYSRYFRELSSYYRITLVNVVFGALAIAFGIFHIVALIPSLTDGEAHFLLWRSQATLTIVGFGLALAWVVSSVKIFRGIKDIRNLYKDQKAPVTDDITIGGIVSMFSHYREHEKTIRTMILVCTLGGFCFLALGIMSSVEFFSFSPVSGTITLNSIALIPSALLALTVAIVSLASSFYFARFSKVWNLRQRGISKSEQAFADLLDEGSR